LQKHRGDVSSQMGGAVSEAVFDSLLGTPAAPPFAFDEDEESRMGGIPYDSPALVGKCRSQIV
jgi:hypothetical protein